MSTPTLIVRVEDAEVRAGLRRAASMLQKDVNRDVLDYTNRRVVPTARSLAPKIIADSLTARATAKGVWLTTTARGKRRSIVAITNFGGTIRTPAVPKGRRRALKMPDGRFVSRVTTPRTVRGQHFLERSAERHRVAIEQHLERSVTATISRRVVGIA